MEEHNIDCPYCGESIPVLIDSSSENQRYYEDCSVCCCPILFTLCCDENLGDTKIIIKREDD